MILEEEGGGVAHNILCEGPAIGSKADLEAGKAREREGGSERDLAAYRKPLWLQRPGRALRVMGETQFVPLQVGNMPLSIPAHEWRRQGQRTKRIMTGKPLWAARRYDVTAVATAAVRKSRTDQAFPALPESGPKAALRPTRTSWAIRTGCRPDRVPDSESPCLSSAGDAPCL